MDTRKTRRQTGGRMNKISHQGDNHSAARVDATHLIPTQQRSSSSLPSPSVLSLVKRKTLRTGIVWTGTNPFSVKRQDSKKNDSLTIIVYVPRERPTAVQRVDMDFSLAGYECSSHLSFSLTTSPPTLRMPYTLFLVVSCMSPRFLFSSNQLRLKSPSRDVRSCRSSNRTRFRRSRCEERDPQDTTTTEWSRPGYSRRSKAH